MLTWARETWHETKRFPWKNTAITLYERFREDRLGLTASSLTFTTLISLVPLFTVALAIFGALPMFDQLQVTLQRWLVSSMVPESIAKPVMVNLNLFVSKASQMGLAGGVFFVVTALALILTIDRKLNDIWRVRRPRGVTQRVLVYWAVLTLGPLVLALSLTLTAYAMGDQRALIKGLSVGTRVWLEALEWVLVVGASPLCTATCPTPMCAGLTPCWVVCLLPSALMPPKPCWVGTLRPFPPTHWFTGRLQRSQFCWYGFISLG